MHSRNPNFVCILASKSSVLAIKTNFRNFSCLFLIERQLQGQSKSIFSFSLFSFRLANASDDASARELRESAACVQFSSFFQLCKFVELLTKKQMAANCGRRAGRFSGGSGQRRFVEVKNNEEIFHLFVCFALFEMKWGNGEGQGGGETAGRGRNDHCMIRQGKV